MNAVFKAIKAMRAGTFVYPDGSTDGTGGVFGGGSGSSGINYIQAAAKASEVQAAQRKKGRKLGRASTLLSGSEGAANVGRKKLLGG